MLRADFIREVTMADAERYHRLILPGGEHVGVGHLVVGNITGVASDVRKKLESERPDPRNPPPIAVVLDSALARMAASLALRLSENPNTAFFKNEPAALEWLDERMGEFTRKAKG